MKKSLLLITLYFFTIALSAQDIIYTVSGDLNNEKVSLDSILVENLTNNTWITFNNLPEELYYQINLTKKAYWGTTGINHLQNNMSGFIESQNMPGEITLTYNNSIPTEARISVFNINGQKIYSSAKQTLFPGNSVQVKLAETGVFLIRVESDLGTQSFKGIGLSKVNSYNVSVIDQSNFNIQTKSSHITFESDFEYTIGDSIRVSVYKEDYYASPSAFNITKSKPVNFLFKISSATTTGISDAFVELDENKTTISSYNIESGETSIEYTGEKPELKPGDVITIDVDTMGYLRKVISVADNNGSLKVKTELANLSDVFVNKEFKLDTELINPGVTLKSNSTSQEISEALTDENGFIHPIEIIYHNKSGNDITKSAFNLKSANSEKFPLFDINEDFSQDIYKGGNMHLYIDKGVNQLKGDVAFEFFFDYSGEYDEDTKIKEGELVAFSYYLKTTYELSASIKLDMSAEDTKEDIKKLLDFNRVTAKFVVGAVPVWITFDVDVYGKYKIKSDASVKADWGFKYLITSTAGGAYSGESNSFVPIKRFDFTETFTPLNIEGTLNVTSRLEVYPKIDVLFYSFIGPVIELVPYVTGEIHAKAQTQITTTETKNFFAWNSGMNLGFDLRTGLKLSFAGLGEKTLGPYEFPIYNTQVWNAPDSLFLLTTLPEEAAPGDTIDLQFGVMDNLMNYVAGCPIFIKGEGEFSDELFLTGTSGTNNITWIIPEDEDGVVIFTASIFDVDKNVVSEVSDSVSLIEEKTFTDPRDGQIYKTTKIGNQIWLAENLNYDVGNGSYCYENNSANCAIYGKLYTWEAAKAACPTGWHLPTDDEWKEMEMAIGMSQSEADKEGGQRGTNEGTKLKATTGWYDNGNGTDDFGFSGLPGGAGYPFYDYYGNYSGTSMFDITYVCFWWSATENSTSHVWYRGLVYNTTLITRYASRKEAEKSVRCVRD